VQSQNREFVDPALRTVLLIVAVSSLLAALSLLLNGCATTFRVAAGTQVSAEFGTAFPEEVECVESVALEMLDGLDLSTVSVRVVSGAFDTPDGPAGGAYIPAAKFIGVGMTAECFSDSAFVHEVLHLWLYNQAGDPDPHHLAPEVWGDGGIVAKIVAEAHKRCCRERLPSLLNSRGI
jgi:hypothetical protein